MNGVLRLAAELLERAADPAAGRDVNERCAAEMAMAMQLGDNVDIKDLLPDKDDALALSPVAWTWLLPLLAQRSVRPPAAVLDSIYDRTASPFIRLSVVQSATATSDGYSEWLHDRIRRAVGDSDGEAVLLGQLLLQVGDAIARAAFRELLDAARPEVREVLGQFVPPGAPDYAEWFGEDRFRD